MKRGGRYLKLPAQRAQYGLVMEYTLNYIGMKRYPSHPDPDLGPGS